MFVPLVEMKIIPAIDILGGKCVRLTKGDYDTTKVYYEEPEVFARQLADNGILNLHVVDLDGAKASHIINSEALRNICSVQNLKVDFGGGIKADADIETAFECGAAQVTVGSIAVKNKPLFLSWLKKYGAEKIILGADVLNGKIAVSGWLEHSDIDLFDFLQAYVSHGVQYVICTDISKDGTLEGSALSLYQSILEHFPDLKLIASGGVSSVQDLKQLEHAGLHGAIVGKAIYEGKIQLNEIAAYQ